MYGAPVCRRNKVMKNNMLLTLEASDFQLVVRIRTL